MKELKTTNPGYRNKDIAVLAGRIAISVLMLTHGIPKMQMLFFSEQIQFPSVLGMSATLSLALAVFAEVFCSILILVGLATRASTVPLIITMLVALFSIHAADVFAKKEPALLYLVGYLVLFLTGSGKYSVDRLISQRRKLENAVESGSEGSTRSISIKPRAV